MDLARVTSVAEAGYLVSLLEEAQIHATARPSENFNAVHGAWTPTYHISIPAADAEAAARVLQAESDHDFGEVAEQVFRPDESRQNPAAVNPWRMLTVLAVVAAAGTAFVADRLGNRAQPVRREAIAAPPRAESLASLFRVLQAAPAPMTTGEAEAGPRHRLRYSDVDDSLVLSVDADRDGRYESHRRFTPAAVGR